MKKLILLLLVLFALLPTASSSCGASSPAASDQLCSPGKPIVCTCPTNTKPGQQGSFSDPQSSTQLCADNGIGAKTDCDCVDSEGRPVIDPGCRGSQCAKANPMGSAGRPSTVSSTCEGVASLANLPSETMEQAAPATACGVKGNVYQYTALENGTLKVTASPSFEPGVSLSLSQDCSNTGDTTSCVETNLTGSTTTLTSKLVAGTTYYIFVNTADEAATGSYALTFEDITTGKCTSPSCFEECSTCRPLCSLSTGLGVDATCCPNSCLPDFCGSYPDCCDKDNPMSWTGSCAVHVQEFCYSNGNPVCLR